MRSPGAALLDLYDTLVWTEWSQLRDTFCARLGVDVPTMLDAFDRTRRARGVGVYASPEEDVQAVVEALGIEPKPSLIRELTDLELTHVTSGVHLHEDSLPTVRALRARGVRTALVSNCSHSTRPVVDRLGLEDEFDVVVLSFEVGAMKPDAEIYLTALERVGGIAPADAVFVDDQARYCDGAAALGIDTRLILRPRAQPAEGVETHVNGHRVIHDLRPLLEEREGSHGTA
jgi:putative hydrolase of the HAD superfamily